MMYVCISLAFICLTHGHLRVSQKQREERSPFDELKYRACDAQTGIDLRDPSSLCLAEVERMSQGLLLFAYATKEESFQGAIGEVAKLLTAFYRFNSGLGIPVALVTNAPVSTLQSNLYIPPQERFYIINPLSEIVKAGQTTSDGLYHGQIGGGWFTRLFYLGVSPFDVTLSTDGNSMFCGTVQKHFGAVAQYDFVVARQDLWNCPRMSSTHNCFMAFRRSAVTTQIFRVWAKQQHLKGLTADDQETLYKSLQLVQKEIPTARLGLMLGSFATSWKRLQVGSGKLLPYPQISSLMWGHPVLMHSSGFSSCDVFSNISEANANRPRVAVVAGKSPPRLVYSVDECREYLAASSPADASQAYIKACGDVNCGKAEHTVSFSLPVDTYEDGFDPLKSPSELIRPLKF